MQTTRFFAKIATATAGAALILGAAATTAGATTSTQHPYTMSWKVEEGTVVEGVAPIGPGPSDAFDGGDGSDFDGGDGPDKPKGARR